MFVNILQDSSILWNLVWKMMKYLLYLGFKLGTRSPQFYSNCSSKWQPTPVLLLGESQGREAWWPAVYGVAQSRTRLKRLSRSSSSSVTEYTELYAKYLIFSSKLLLSLLVGTKTSGHNSCESWTVKKTECQIIDAFELWCWRRLRKVTWTARGWNKSILREIKPEYSLEGLMLKLQYFWSSDVNRWLIEKNPWCWERLRAEEEGVSGWDG